MKEFFIRAYGIVEIICSESLILVRRIERSKLEYMRVYIIKVECKISREIYASKFLLSA